MDAVPDFHSSRTLIPIDEFDDGKVSLGIQLNPLNKNAYDIVGTDAMYGGIKQQIADENSLFFAFCCRPVTEAFFKQFKIFGALYSLTDVLIGEVQARQYLGNRYTDLPQFVFL
jgi:hypothetical protein